MTTTSNLSRRNFLGKLFSSAVTLAIGTAAVAPLTTAAMAAPQFYADGFRKGKTIGRKHGYEDGYKQAYQESYEDEIVNGRALTMNRMHPDYLKGYKDGYAKGYKMGYQSGAFGGDHDGREDAKDMKDNLREQMKDCMENGTCS